MTTARQNQAASPYKLRPIRYERRSYDFRAGQVEQVLGINSGITIYDIAREIGISPRQAYNLCRRMVQQGRITLEAVPFGNHFKYLVSLAK